MLSLVCICLPSAYLSSAQKKDASIITLNQCWRYRSSGLLALRPATDRSNLYVAEDGGRVSAIALSSGTKLWSTDLGGEIRSNVAVQGSTVFVAASDASKRLRLRALSVASGIPTQETDLPYSEEVRLVAANGRLVVALRSGYLASFAIGAQKPEWQTTVDGMDISNAIFTPGKMIVPAGKKNIRIISLDDGATLTTTQLENEVASLGLFDEDVVAGDDRGNLTRFDNDGKTVYWRLRNGARISSIVETNQGVLTASLDNFVYMVSGYYGDIRWKRRMPGRVSSIVADGDIAIVLTIGEPRAAILNLENGKPAGELSISENDAFTQPAINLEGGGFLFFTNGQVLAENSGPCLSK